MNVGKKSLRLLSRHVPEAGYADFYVRRLLFYMLLCMPVGQVLAEEDARLLFLSRQLQFSKDPRARAQTALILGASRDPRAVTSLCAAMGDAEALVRVAVVNALAELKVDAAIQCLMQHPQDADVEVAQAIERALKLLGPGGTRTPGLYVALQIGNNGSSLSVEDLGQLESSLREKLATLGAVFAPPNETQEEAHKVMHGGRLKGYLLLTEVQPNGTAGLKIKLLCMTYPDKALRAHVSVKGSGPTNKLIPALVSRVLDDSASQCGWSER